MSLSDGLALGTALPGNARVIRGLGQDGPAEMTVLEIEGTKPMVLDAKTELDFWSRVRGKAQAKAKEIMAQAMDEAQAIREQARQEGLAAGLEQAKSLAEAQMAEAGRVLGGLLSGLQGERQNLWAGYRQEFAALLRLAVGKTLRAELSDRRHEVLAGLLEQALELLDAQDGFTAVVHPGDEAQARVLLTEAQKAQPDLDRWKIKTDPELSQGGLRLESSSGLVDNTVSTRFAQVSEILDRLEFSGEES
jgi:flagellar assembly protein FliH